MYVLKYPLSLGLFVTNRCNFSCGYCIVDAKKSNDWADELTKEETFSFLDKVQANKVQSIDFSGGEPFCRHDFPEILHYAVQKGLSVSLVSNGSLIDKQTASFLKNLNSIKPIRIRISLDAAHPEVNDAYRFSGSFTAALNALDKLQENGIVPELSSVVHKKNISSFTELLLLMQKRNMKVLHVNPIMSAGRGVTQKELLLPLKDFRMVMEQRNEWECTYGVKIKADSPLDFLVAPEKDADIEKRCLLAHFFLGVHANGDIYPCPNMMDIILGNIRKDDLFSIWQNAPFLKEIRNTELLKGACATCKYKERCGGGCRALAWQEKGDYLCPDPYCWIANPQD